MPPTTKMPVASGGASVGLDLGADAVERRGEPLDRLVVLGQRPAAGDLHLDEERAGDRRLLGDELEEPDQARLARSPASRGAETAASSRLTPSRSIQVS